MARILIPIMLAVVFIQHTWTADWRQEYCSGDRGVCMIYERNGSQVDVFLRNNFPFDGVITTVNVVQAGAFKNVSANTPLPVTLVCKGKEPLKAASFIIADTTQAWDLPLNWFWTYGTFSSKVDEKYPYRLPYEMGKRFRVGQAFNDTPTHHGDAAYSIDWLMPEGTPICAAREGTVIRVVDKYTGSGFTKEYLDKTNVVEILHDDGSFAHYAHLKQYGVKVKEGDAVKAGDVIAFSGNTGYSQCPHLHFAVFRPRDMKKCVTIPCGFITDYSPYEILEKGEAYSYSGKFLKGERPFVYFEEVILCKNIINHQPVDIATTFSAMDKIHVFVPINAKQDRRIQINLYKNDSPAPMMKYSWIIKKGWWQTYSDPYDFSKVPNPAGIWKAEIIIDKESIGSKEFTVMAVP